MEDEGIEDISISEVTAEHLHKIGTLLASSCPAASRFYIYNRERSLTGKPESLNNRKEQSKLFCIHCGSIWSQKNYRVRISSRAAMNLHLKKLLKIEEQRPWNLSKCQEKKLKKWHESVNKIVYHCLICQKKTVLPSNKKRNAKYKSEAMVTPVSKVKRKKKDLNAGLFFTLPSNKMHISEETSNICTKTEGLDELLTDEKNNLKEVKTPVSSNIFSTSLNKSVNRNKGSLENRSIPAVKLGRPDTSITQGQSSGKKKKKTLLARILKQEQSNKKKTGLASFLVSL